METSEGMGFGVESVREEGTEAAHVEAGGTGRVVMRGFSWPPGDLKIVKQFWNPAWSGFGGSSQRIKGPSQHLGYECLLI